MIFAKTKSGGIIKVKKVNRVLSYVLVLALVMGILPFVYGAALDDEEEFVYGVTLEYSYDEDKEIYLDDYTDFDYEVSNDGTVEDLKEKLRAIIKEVEHES